MTEVLENTELKKIKAVHPLGGKILVECLKKEEMLGTKLYVGEDTEDMVAPQALVIELGPRIPADNNLAVGDRVYWNGQGVPIDDPRCTNGRQRALLEMHNIIAKIES